MRVTVPADPIDLLDDVAVKLEQARAVTWAVADQIERSRFAEPLGRNLCGGIGAVYTQLLEAQDLIERLSIQLTVRGQAGRASSLSS